MSRLEISNQQLLYEASETQELAESRPVHELADFAGEPDISEKDVLFPFANDQCSAPYLDQLRMRTAMPDFMSASNRTALLIGESSLAAALGQDGFIPEETIVLLDNAPGNNRHMDRYVHALRTAESPEDWWAQMNIVANNQSYALDPQINKWHAYGYEHALADPYAFQTAQYAARNKAITTWKADVRNLEDIQMLADALHANDAHITIANLTNVIQFCSLHEKVGKIANALSRLPFTDQAPILTTATSSTNVTYMGMTGPFFGLDNLADEGQRKIWTTKGTRTPVTIRDYYEADSRRLMIRSLIHASAGRALSATREDMQFDHNLAPDTAKRVSSLWYVP